MARARDVRSQSLKLLRQVNKARNQTSQGSIADASTRARKSAKPPTALPNDGAFPVVALAASAGGLVPLWNTLAHFPADFPAAVVVLIHRAPPSRLHEFLDERVALPVSEAANGDVLRPGTVLVAPTGVHMTVDKDGRVALRDGPAVNFTCPAADVLFQSLAEGLGGRVIAVVFSGRGCDGTRGTQAIRRTGGVVIAQDEASAEYSDMPVSAADVGKVDLVLRVEQIAPAVRLLLDSAHAEAVAEGPPQLHRTGRRKG